VAGKLPELRRREALALIEAFATDIEHHGDLVVGSGRNGSFTIHLEHGRGLRPDQLSRALKYMGVSRDEFDAWRRSS